jgi:hypothetical protein
MWQRRPVHLTAAGKQKDKQAKPWWLTLVILGTQEAEIRRLTVQRQPQPKRSQDGGPEFKPQYRQKKERKRKTNRKGADF